MVKKSSPSKGTIRVTSRDGKRSYDYEDKRSDLWHLLLTDGKGQLKSEVRHDCDRSHRKK